jgi:phytoene/squalene synthetase
MDKLYNDVANKISRLVTQEYSSSFSRAVSFLEKETRQAIYNVYGFVRFADEIVDTFYSVDKDNILKSFEDEYYAAYERGVSTNPILHSFQLTVKKYNIDDNLIKAFLKSMHNDLYKTLYNDKKEMNDYIYGSADVVGLMCLKVFVNGDEALYERLKEPAMRLGSAFQKVNFLRDIKSDTEILKRQYFPELVGKRLTDEIKEKIITEISADFNASFMGLKDLPGRSKLAVAIAYCFYKTLLKKIQNKPAGTVMESRIRISGLRKSLLFIKAYAAYVLNLI